MHSDQQIVRQDHVASGLRRPRGAQTWCQANPELYLALSENPPTQRADSRAVKAREMCGGCPVFASCLHEALTGRPIDGFVAGTTNNEREWLREALGVAQQPEVNTAHAAGTEEPYERPDGRALDSQVVLIEEHRHPEASLEDIAQMLGWSLASVKRHRNRARAAAQERTHIASEHCVQAYNDLIA